MKYGAAVLLTFALGCTSTQVTPPAASSAASSGAADEVRKAEKEWNDAIDHRDVAAMERFLAPTYFLAVGVQGRPLQIAPRETWLANLPLYDIRSYSIDDIRVNVYGDVAIVTMLYTQDALVGRQQRPRSAQFFITDVWVRHADGWRVAERHSSRPEPPPPAPQ